jgi:hypothetical protein
LYCGIEPPRRCAMSKFDLETLMPAPKNIILLSDGTGNAANRVWKSNVWRVF